MVEIQAMMSAAKAVAVLLVTTFSLAIALLLLTTAAHIAGFLPYKQAHRIADISMVMFAGSLGLGVLAGVVGLLYSVLTGRGFED